MHPPTGWSPDQEAVHRAEGELAPFRSRASAGHRIQDRRHFGTGEIRIEQKAGLLSDEWFMTRCFEPIAGVGGSAVLPYDGAVHRPPGCALPYQRGLALICY